MPRILVVDDDSNLRAIRRMLEPKGFEIEAASDGRDGLRKSRARPAELVLCDVFVPEQDGTSFANCGANSSGRKSLP